jgi:exodeoxyribonuclease VII small subunit
MEIPGEEGRPGKPRKASEMKDIGRTPSDAEPVRSFEEKMKRLEEIVRVMEQGDRPLEESLTLFEEGVALSDQCQKILEEAERKVSILLSSSKENGGASVEAPFRRES